MNRPHHKSESENITQSLEHVHPVADRSFQHLLENQLIAEWYRQTEPQKKKRELHTQIPITFIASISLILTASLILISLSVGSQISPLSSYSEPAATPVPTPETRTPSPASLVPDSPSVLAILEPDMVAIQMPIARQDISANGYQIGDIIDIVATINREQLDKLEQPIQSEVADLLAEYETDELYIYLIENVKILYLDTQKSVLMLQVSHQQAVIVTWLINSQISYKIQYNS